MTDLQRRLLQESISHAAQVCRKHVHRDFYAGRPGDAAFIRSYDNAERARYYAVIAFRRAALLFPEIREVTR